MIHLPVDEKMKRYYNIFVAITILLTGSSFLSAQCVDDPNGTVATGPAPDCATLVD